MTRCRENLSSGEKRARKSQRDIRGSPYQEPCPRRQTWMGRFGHFALICYFLRITSEIRAKSSRRISYFQGIHSVPVVIQSVHEMHGERRLCFCEDESALERNVSDCTCTGLYVSHFPSYLAYVIMVRTPSASGTWVYHALAAITTTDYYTHIIH